MRVLQAIFLSLGLHFLLVLILQNLPASAPPPKREVVEVSILPPASQNETKQVKNQVVRQTLLPEKIKVSETEEKLKFLSEKLQRVKEQSRAAISGLTENRDNAPKSSKLQQQKVTASPNRAQSAFDPYATTRQKKLTGKGDQEPRQQKENSSLSGFSTISEAVDVKIGSITALNTDQYLFYSFFKRINELVYIRWSGLVQTAEEQVALSLVGKTSNDKWTTQIEIWVKANGEFHSAHIMKESGIRRFDQAAVLAFKQAGLFPNPPQELVEEDGLIHLKYNLTVFFEPRAFVQRQN